MSFSLLRVACRCIATLIFATVAVAVADAPHTQAPEGPGTAAILFDGPADQHAKAYIHALFLRTLLTHFQLKADLIAVDNYHAGQLASYRAGFFLGATLGTTVPPALLADIRTTDHPFTWMGFHIGQLLDTPEARRRYGFSFREFREDLAYRSVMYKETSLFKGDPGMNLVSVDDPKAVSVLATAVGRNGVSNPYVLRNGNFWYVADAPFDYMTDDSRYLAICDLLHDILGINHPADSRALVRIEDVSADDDPADLRKIADMLGRRHVPFQMALIPVFVDPQHGLEIHLPDRRDLVDALHYMVAHGGTPVMHGVTHQYHGLSGDEYEFWDEMANHAIVGDSDAFVMRRLRTGFADCFEAGIFPLVFEVPHYGASETDYRAIARVFSAAYDRPMVVPDQTSTQLAPYPLVDQYGRYIIPENLGYLPEDKPDPKVIIHNARAMRVVRDSIASFYFHPFLNRDLLDQSVRGIEDLGYHFVSLRDFDVHANLDGRYLMQTKSGSVTVSPSDEFWRVRVFDWQGRLVRNEISSKRYSQPVRIDITVPERGWAAVDCLHNLPRESATRSTWIDRLKHWWDGVTTRHTSAAPAGTRSAWLLWQDGAAGSAAHDQASYRRVLETFGYTVKVTPAASFNRAPEDHGVLLVVPLAADQSLNEAQHREVIRYLAAGGSVVADGHQAWLDKIGFEFPGGRVPVSTVSDPSHADVPMSWRPTEYVDHFRPPEGTHDLMLDVLSGRPLAVAGSYGSGRYVYLAAPLDSYTDDGTSRYPYFPEYLRENFGASTPLRSHRLEAYFDPSDRPGADLNRLATLWRRSGIGTVYAAAWKTTRTFQFPYSEFIKACHRNGVAVYAWVMLPMTTPKMWEEHPEWREKTASGADGLVGWRYLMNLQNPTCFRAAMGWMHDTLDNLDWDGVNISELNFDADFQDPMRPDKFVPMNDDVRAAFRKTGGFDPKDLFQPGSRYYYKRNPAALAQFQHYREDIVIDWHRQVLTELEPLRKKHGWEVIVTAMDSLHDDYVRPALGIDSRRIVDLMREFPFTLQVEDQARFWHQSPERYLRFADTYRKLVPDPSRLMFDVNVVDGRDVADTYLPSKRAVGTELALTVASAASPSGRVAVFSEYSVTPTDWELIRIALTQPASAMAHGNGWNLTAPKSLVMMGAHEAAYELDGSKWPVAAGEGLLLPPGRHVIAPARSWLNFLDSSGIATRLTSSTADLISVTSDRAGMSIHYRSPGRAVMMFEARPAEILVDGVPANLEIEPGDRNWAVVFPAGDHRATVIGDTGTGRAVHLWSWLMASSISIFGVLSTMLMAAIYLQLRWKRRRSQL
jgi:uncharacterized protein YdaL